MTTTVRAYTITNDHTDQQVTYAPSRDHLTDTIGDWFPEAPGDVRDALDGLETTLARGDEGIALEEVSTFLGLTVARADYTEAE